MVRGGGPGILRVHPVGWDDGQHLVDLEEAAATRLEVGDLLVASDEVQVDRPAVAQEWIEPDVRGAVLSHRDEPTERLGLDERLDLLRGNVAVVTVEDQGSLTPVATASRSCRRPAASPTM